MEDGSGDRHSSEDSCNSSFSLRNIPPGKELSGELHGLQSHVVGKNDRKISDQEQGQGQEMRLGTAVQDGVSAKGTSSSLIPKYLHPQKAKEVEEECLEVVGKERVEEEEIAEEEDEVEEEVAAVEKKVDYRNDTQISTKEKEKDKKSAVEGSMKGSFGVLPPNPPSNVEVHTCLTTLHRIAFRLGFFQHYV